MAYSRATNLTILACPLNMQGMPGALQVLAALLHGVQSIDTYNDKEPVVRGSLDLTPIQVEKASAVFHQALMLHQVWSGPLPVCLAEHHQGKVRRLRLILATLSHLTKAEISSLQDGLYLPGGTTEHGLVYGCVLSSSAGPFFFHEYGRRVGMVPRSSLKEGKKRQMVEKGTKTPKNKPQNQTPKPAGRLHHLVVFPIH